MLANIFYFFCSTILLGYSGCSFTTNKQTSGNATNKQINELKLKIYHYKVPCIGEGLQLCYLVSKNGTDTEYFYNEIVGFDYQWGYNYEIIVNIKTIENPAADGSSQIYSLAKSLKKEKILNDQTFELQVSVDDYSVFETKNNKILYAGIIPVTLDKYSIEELLSSKIGIFKHHESGNEILLVGLK